MPHWGKNKICRNAVEKDPAHWMKLNESLNGYAESPSNGFRWKVYIEWIVFRSKTIHSNLANACRGFPTELTFRL